MNRLRRAIPWAVTAGAVGLFVAYTFKWDRVQVDGIALALLGILLAIPFFEFVRRIRIDDFEAEIAPREVAEVRDRASSELASTPSALGAEPERYVSIMNLATQDPVLGLAKVRIELEQSLKALYVIGEPDKNRHHVFGLSRIVNGLAQRGDISAQMARALRDVVALANRAVHGEYVRAPDAEELALLGVRLLEELKLIYDRKASMPIESVIIGNDEVDRLRASKFRVATVVPSVENPRRNTYVLDQEGLDRLLEGYNEYAEFIVSIERIDSESWSSS